MRQRLRLRVGGGLKPDLIESFCLNASVQKLPFVDDRRLLRACGGPYCIFCPSDAALCMTAIFEQHQQTTCHNTQHTKSWSHSQP